jgi:serine/threonine-protein kinase SRPK3
MRYRAIKILTAHATRLHEKGVLLELDILKAISSEEPSEHTLRLPRLHDHFEMEGPHGRHLCLVQSVLSTDIGTFR